MIALTLDRKLHLECKAAGGDEMRSGYVRYVQGIQPNILARNTFIVI